MSYAKILVIEDDPDTRLGYEVLLGAHHYQTFFADDAATARDQASVHQPDLMILDLGLPDRDGFLVLEDFDLYLFMVPVVVVSARDPQGNRERALKAGARAYVQKPWNDRELLATIHELLVANELPAVKRSVAESRITLPAAGAPGPPASRVTPGGD